MASLEGRSMHRIDSRSVIVPFFSYYGIEDNSSLVSYCLDGVMVFVCKACLVKAQLQRKKKKGWQKMLNPCAIFVIAISYL